MSKLVCLLLTPRSLSRNSILKSLNSDRTILRLRERTDCQRRCLGAPCLITARNQEKQIQPEQTDQRCQRATVATMQFMIQLKYTNRQLIK